MVNKDRAKIASDRFNRLLGTEDVRLALYKEGVYGRIKKSGHVVPQQGSEYVELTNVVFKCDKPTIIDAPEYDDLIDGTWYQINYEPLIAWQIPNVIQKLIDDNDTRQAIIQFYDPDKNEKARENMICTMYVSLRLTEGSSQDKQINDVLYLTYTVHMRSSDVREFTSDLKWHKQIAMEIAKVISEKAGKDTWINPIVWCADSIQCWDKDWNGLEDFK